MRLGIPLSAVSASQIREMLTESELRILGYLEAQGGQARRDRIVADLTREDGAQGRDAFGCTSSSLETLFSRWTMQLRTAALIVEVRDAAGFYSHHELTDFGRGFLQACRRPTPQGDPAARIASWRLARSAG